MLNFLKKTNTVTIPVINKSNNKLPKYETNGSAGMDIRVDLSKVTPETTLKGYGDVEVIWAGEGHSVPMVRVGSGARVLLPTGLYSAIPDGWQISFRPRSGLSIKQGVTLINTPSTIDAEIQ